VLIPIENSTATELVITGPGAYGPALAYRARCRTTLGVLTQLLVEAQREVIIGAPYLQGGYGLSSGPIAAALKAALARGVNADIMSTARGLGTIDRNLRAQAGHGRLRFFRPLANVQDEDRLGSHAKFCVVDGRQAYVGSANLTGPGLSEHVELGLLVRGDIARQIKEFWEYCTQIGFFVEVPLT
jgi:phosphatidylserine/phosphatidylglycerophosphate/cardiolipin synthase-like enzyme